MRFYSWLNYIFGIFLTMSTNDLLKSLNMQDTTTMDLLKRLDPSMMKDCSITFLDSPKPSKKQSQSQTKPKTKPTDIIKPSSNIPSSVSLGRLNTVETRDASCQTNLDLINMNKLIDFSIALRKIREAKEVTKTRVQKSGPTVTQLHYPTVNLAQHQSTNKPETKQEPIKPVDKLRPDEEEILDGFDKYLDMMNNLKGRLEDRISIRDFRG